MSDRIENALIAAENLARKEECLAGLCDDIALKNAHANNAEALRLLICLVTGEGL